ncbi:serine hydrolase domain-containing protein [Maribacter arenosus]|uniref:Beta-lactamase family protein n=1 Tax=Maribacter arenosus TaxID=1854708 RepID=A0ABR7VB91_9FLAO|nr:serine hydrolase domain-containing protein [Maribacter arenosus]MBD0850882.1 beta-lactamase family protein [Maribacter arenosus]
MINYLQKYSLLLFTFVMLYGCQKETKNQLLKNRIEAAVNSRQMPDTTKQLVSFESPDWITLISPDIAELNRHFEYYLPTVTISKRDTKIKRLEENLSETLGQELLTSTFFKKETTLDDICARKAINGVIVLHKGKIKYEQYPDMNPDDRHITASIAKSFVGTVTAILADQRLLHEQDSITKYLPELRGAGFEDITIEHLLRMASGINCKEHLPNMESFTNPESCFYQLLEQTGLFPEPKAGIKKDFLQVIKESGIAEPPGITYDYSGVNSVLLAMIAERITATPYHELVSSFIWSKIGAEQDALISMASSGITGSYGPMMMTLRDMARYGLAFTEDADIKIASDRYLEEIRKGNHELFLSKGGFGDLVWSRKYEDQGAMFQSYHWDVVFEDGDFIKHGVGGQALYISPSKRLIIAFNSSPKTSYDENHSMQHLVRSLALLDLFN